MNLAEHKINLSPRDKSQQLEEMMSDFGTEVLYTAFSYVKDYGIAEDIAQEVFVKAYKKLEEFRGESSLKTWIIRITINQSKDYLKTWYFRKMVLSNKIGDFVTGKVKTPELEVVSQEESDQLGANVLSLPLKYREVIFLYFYEEMTINEIAKVLNQNINTTKTRLYKAKERLSKIYQERIV